MTKAKSTQSKYRPFNRVLVANRGEIACRIIRTANDMGFHTVAVYTSVDQNSPHVAIADDAVWIGEGPVSESYLSQSRIIEAANKSGAQAVHPGYGFLSENAEFALACGNAGLVFVGPSAEAIQLMGNKAEAKRRMQLAGIPCLEGYEGGSQDDAVLHREAQRIGMPLMIKAAAGGGGRGMRLVQSAEDIKDALSFARSEALKAFGNGDVILERAVLTARHVEIQIFADSMGNTISFNERDCSVQRRHQKVIEEAPCPVMNNELRQQMNNVAVQVAKAIDYCGAGTVEFLLDDSGQFFFLEMNTRLQVEHPVTELITNTDLVALQLNVAQGQALQISQDEVSINGHAIEARLYAEDPGKEFLPQSGTIQLWTAPTGTGIRVDEGVCTKQLISSLFDPMIAKIIAHGETREIARRRLIRALEQTQLFGVQTNVHFLIQCLKNKNFVAGQVTTEFVRQEFSAVELAPAAISFDEAAIAAVLSANNDYCKAQGLAVCVSPQLRNWASAGGLASQCVYQVGQDVFELEIAPREISGKSNTYCVKSSDQEILIEILAIDESIAKLKHNGHRTLVHFLVMEGGHVYLSSLGRNLYFENLITLRGPLQDEVSSGTILAPMHGLVLQSCVTVGDVVSKGQRLLVMEAMKMQHEIVAPVGGVVEQLCAKEGDQITVDEMLLAISPQELL